MIWVLTFAQNPVRLVSYFIDGYILLEFKMSQSFQQRHQVYEAAYDNIIINRLPIVIKLDGRSFSKLSENLQKPFDHNLTAIFNDTMLSLAKQIDGVIFGYQYSDKIIFILKNDKTKDTDPWCGNKIQALASLSASIATYEFMVHLWEMDPILNLNGPISFKSKVWAIPDNNEIINQLILRQYACVQHAVNESVHSVLKTKYGAETNQLLEGKTLEQRKQILSESGISFDSLPKIYRNGSGVYLTPTLINTPQGQITKHKWLLDFELPIFIENKEFIKTIITTGSDIFRPERDL